MRHGLVRDLLAAVVVFLVAFDVQPVAAEDTDAAGLEEVVVTARHKEELLQNVPLAISAFSAADIQQRGILDMRDIAALTPGFSFQTQSGSGYTQPVIRGAAQVTQTLEQNVSFFLDGIYLPRNYVTNLGFDLLDRVEVVKGPQSARYGRNAFMGAVNYISKAPTDDFTAAVTGTVGNHDNRDGTVLVSGAAIPGVLRFLGGIDYKGFGGTWPNLAPYCDIGFSEGTNCELGASEKITYHTQAELLVNDRLTVDVSYYHFHFIDGGNAQDWFAELGANSQELNCGQYNPNVRPAGSGLGGGGQWFRLYCGAIPVANVPQDPRGYSQQLTSDFYSGSLSWKITDYLTLNDLAGYIGSGNTSLDYKDVPGCTFFIPGLCIFEDGPLGNSRQTSNELRLTFDNHGFLNATVGVSYTDLYDYSTSNFVALPPLSAVPTAPIAIYDASAFAVYATLFRTVTKDTIWSPFAELNFSFLDDKAHLSIEGRDQSEKKIQESLSTAATSGLEPVAGGVDEGTFHSFTPRFSADYHLTTQAMFYASAAKGVHAGGFNGTAINQAENGKYGPDQNWTYEFGSKNTLFDGRVQFNADVYYINWTNEQINAQDPNSTAALPLIIIENLGTVHSKGVELEAAIVPVKQHLTITANLALNDARFANGTYDKSWQRTASAGAVCDNVVCYENGYIGGKQTPYSSKVQAAAGAEWKDILPLGDAVDYYARFDTTYQTKQYNEDINLSWEAARTLTNASVGLTGKKWEVQLWSRNLFNLQYVASTIVGQPNMQYDSYLGDRRTLGITAKLRY